VFETQPFASVSTTERVSVPAAPAVNVIVVPVGLLVIVPPEIDHAYVEPACSGTLAVFPVEPGATETGAETIGADGSGSTVTAVGAEGALVHPAAVTVTV
jgi:hypothetical protein